MEYIAFCMHYKGIYIAIYINFTCNALELLLALVNRNQATYAYGLRAIF